MSFGSAFGGFGQNNNNNTTSGGFGGFGSNNNSNNTSAFGSSNTGAFGQSNNNASTTSLFGSNTGGGFGSGTSAFGSNNNNNNNNTTSSAFGARPAFGQPATSSTSLFGTPTTTAASTGFGSGFGSNTATTSSPFGANTGTSLFGSNNNTANTSFSGTTAGGTGSLFGGSSTTGAFGATNNPGIGTNIPPPSGTQNPPFTPFTEKEANSTAQNSFQNILFQDAYKNYSAEELRLADYAQGRRFGNAASGFGSTSTFGGNAFGMNNNNNQTTGGFGSTNTGSSLFGNNNNPTTSAFGANNNASTSNSFGGSSLFGAKPAATGGLFGNNAASTTTQPSTSLFGSGSGFGSTNNNATTTGGFGSTSNTGGLFGNNQQKSNPFGSTTTPAASTGTGLFGSANTGSTSLFGNNNTTNTPATGTSLFGNTQQNSTTPSAFGSGFGSQPAANTGSSLFGNANNQQKPGGLFGSTTTPSTGLFGSTNSTTQNANPFGATQQPQQTTSLFGAKPAATGIFGNPAAQSQAPTNPFGGLGANNAAQQQPASTGLFGNLNANKPATSLFGTPTPAAGGSVFGTPNNQQQSSLFGNSIAQQPQQQSIFATSTPQQNAQGGLTAQIDDPSAFGAAGLFANLGAGEVPNPGPLCTPLSGQKPRKHNPIPLWKLHPGSASKFNTPTKRGYGFTYSTYGSPSTPGSVASTPGGLSSSLMGGGSLSRALGKSMSVSNLRKSYNANEGGILAPGAFSASASSRNYSNVGSLKKLQIDRNLKVDLFTLPSKGKENGGEVSPVRRPTKRVSFETNKAITENGEDSEATMSPPPEQPVPGSAEDLGFIRPSKTTPGAVNGNQPRNSSSGPEMEQVNGNELAIIPEGDSSPAPAAETEGVVTDKKLGEYWMSPTKEEIQKMNRVQRSQVANFTVGREKAGYVRWRVPVDLTNIDLDNIFGRLVDITIRTATVYPAPVSKPPVGKGLNNPAEISLEQSWPRATSRRRLSENKHIQRLRAMPNTEFIDYNSKTGTWLFNVEHFTTYGLDYDDEDGMDTTVDESALEANAPKIQQQVDESPAAEADDTFDFRKRRLGLPGAFDMTGEVSEDEDETEMADDTQQSFLGDRSAGSPSDQHRRALVNTSQDDEDMLGDEEYDEDQDQPASGDLVRHRAAEQEDEEDDSPYDHQLQQRAEIQDTPGGVLRARLRALKDSTAPTSLRIADGDDWTNMLQRTVSPMKRDRAALKAADQDALYDEFRQSMGPSPAKRVVSDGRGFATSMDLMKSLFDMPESPGKPAFASSIKMAGFKRPFSIADKTQQPDDENAAPDSANALIRQPNQASNGSLVVTKKDKPLLLGKNGVLSHGSGLIKGRELDFGRHAQESSAKALGNQVSLTNIRVVKGTPTVSIEGHPSLSAFSTPQNAQSPASYHEKLVWELASLLFDTRTGTKAVQEVERKAAVSRFWQNLVEEASARGVSLARSYEDKAVAALGAHRVADACKHLLDGKDFRLATLVSLIGTDDVVKKDMREQVKEWRDTNAFAEFSEPIRALYELLGGNVCAVAGMKGSMENRMESFVISQRFGMDWKQAFGLRLWYAISTKDDVAAAVDVFAEDIQQEKEMKPEPWYVEQGIQPSWDDTAKNTREDLLWGLLRLFATKDVDVEEVLQPENSQLSPSDYRLTWQLGRALLTTGKVSFGANTAEANAKLDAATMAFASQLTMENHWLEAIFVLVHLSDPTARKAAIEEHLAAHAGSIGAEPSETFSTLTQNFKIPPSWVWRAKAIFMRDTRKDAAGEVNCLLKAQDFTEAHRVFVSRVAPLTVIERDWEGLAEVLRQFQGHEGVVSSGWSVGGGIYKDYLELIRLRSLPQGQGKKAGRKEIVEVVDRLMDGLPVLRESVEKGHVLQVAAVADMADCVGKVVVEMAREGEMRLSNVLNLPLTEDGYLRFSNELATAYYREVMAGRA